MITNEIDEEIDPNDPLGDIRIRDNQTVLSVQSTYLDYWFDVLVDGYKSLKNQKKVALEMKSQKIYLNCQLLSRFASL